MRLQIWALAILAGAVLIMWSAPGSAHHSINTFWNPDSQIEISGVLKSARIMNPHSQIIITVTEGQQQTDWVGTSSSLQVMRQAGWLSGETIKAGTRVTAVGHPPRAEGAKGILINKLTTADGRVFNIRPD